MATIEFELNGEPTRVDAADGTPLLWVLRDVLNLTGTKYSCGKMLCGACTVHLDGVAARTCQLPFEAVAGRSIVTIEGLGADQPEGLHPVQRAWLQECVPQCGFCQSGQIMTAAALLKQNAKPSADEIDEAMRGTLCRCGTYQRIRKAVRRAAED